MNNERLKLLRERIGLTQKDIAEIIGINRVQYNQYENNYISIPIKHLISLSSYFKVSVDYLLGLSSKKSYLNYHETNIINAGERLKSFRKSNNLTQKELANILNTTFSSIAWNEKGRNLISTPFLYTICKTYNISADYLLDRIDNPKYLKK